MVGVPTGWRTLDRDSVKDPALHQIILKADIVSPWTVGRYRSLQGVADHAREQLWPFPTSPGARKRARSICRSSFRASAGNKHAARRRFR